MHYNIYHYQNLGTIYHVVRYLQVAQHLHSSRIEVKLHKNTMNGIVKYVIDEALTKKLGILP